MERDHHEKCSLGFISSFTHQINKFIWNRITVVIDWKQSLPTIIAAIIGSGLIVSAFSTINSFILKPIIDIESTFPYKGYYGISLINIGYAPATHLRLTIHYHDHLLPPPDYHPVYTNENMTVKNDYSTSSVVAFLPRLTPGGNISIDIAYFDSVVATYDQGSYEYASTSSSTFFAVLSGLYFFPSILIVLAFLSFAIAFRHKRRSKSKLASDILKDIMKVRNELNNDKGDPNGIILRLHPWQSNADNERQVVSNYRDYQKIDDFYSTVKSRNCYLLQNEVSSDVLTMLNKDCVDKANITYREIDWRKFHKLDLVLLIPAIVLGSLFVTIVDEVITNYYLYDSLGIYANVIEAILRGISSFFIIRITFRATQGIIVQYYGLPPIFRSFAFLLFCFVIVATPLEILFYPAKNMDVPAYVPVLVDMGRMFLLMWVVWRRYMKHKASPSFLVRNT